MCGGAILYYAVLVQDTMNSDVVFKRLNQFLSYFIVYHLFIPVVNVSSISGLMLFSPNG